jgi:hypothetical protein
VSGNSDERVDFPKKRWVITREAFDRMLAELHPDIERAGEQYENIRRKLVKLFEWRGRLSILKRNTFPIIKRNTFPIIALVVRVGLDRARARSLKAGQLFTFKNRLAPELRYI